MAETGHYEARFATDRFGTEVVAFAAAAAPDAAAEIAFDVAAIAVVVVEVAEVRVEN